MSEFVKKYIEVKVVEAEQMMLDEFEKRFNCSVYVTPATNSPGYCVTLHDGYVSWCPKKQFEDANRPCDGMTFGHAIEAAKKGHKVSRSGWNGKGMFVVYQKGYPEGIPCNKQTAEAFGLNEGDLFKVRPYLQMRCADGTHQMWLASQSDILEDDWMIVEG